MWVATSFLFSWYAASFGNFNRTYGTLGAVIGFMTWIWISAMVILIGAELDAELECQDPTLRKRATGGFHSAVLDLPKTGRLAPRRSVLIKR